MREPDFSKRIRLAAGVEHGTGLVGSRNEDLSFGRIAGIFPDVLFVSNARFQLLKPQIVSIM
jgi:hypothetical protein